jgi:filamentous hemagglutinin family protein
MANPAGGSVSQGSASIAQSGNTLTVTETSNKAVINWNSFDIGAGETTQFVQPSSSAIVLNRVNSTSASQIYGNLTANGNIVIINQNGVLFGAGSKVDVNSLVVSTANISDSDFMNATGPLNFNLPGNPNASIINNGTITAADAGLVGLVAPNVINNGTITANLGRVQLASGDTATVDLYGDGLMEIAVSNQVLSQVVQNNGLIQADGGKIALTAAAGSKVVNSLIANTGVLQAQTVAQENGVITIANATPGGTISNTGTIAAKGVNSGDQGGSISLSADNIQQQGIINADGLTSGGSINLAFNTSYTDSSGSVTSARGTGLVAPFPEKAVDFWVLAEGKPVNSGY